MKTKELVRQLQEADPTGEIEVCVGDRDIYFVEREAAFYDGCLHVLKHDPTKVGRCYSIVGMEIRSDCQKLMLRTMDLEDVLLDHPEAEVTFHGNIAEGYKASVEKTREEMRAIHRKEKAPEETS